MENKARAHQRLFGSKAASRDSVLVLVVRLARLALVALLARAYLALAGRARAPVYLTNCSSELICLGAQTNARA